MTDQQQAAVNQNETKKKKKFSKVLKIMIGVLGIMGLAVAGTLIYLRPWEPEGFYDYEILYKQHYSRYSEGYDYGEVVRIDYVELNGIEENVQQIVNELIYETAMDRVNYWHLEPDDTVKEFQEEYFSMFHTTVTCVPHFHSQFLLSISFEEQYSPGNPINMTQITERAVNIDLETGEVYRLQDVFELNKDFIKLWYYEALEMEERISTHEISILRSWFRGSDRELEKEYTIFPYFYINEEEDFVIGISFDPKAEGFRENDQEEENAFSATFSYEEIEPYRTESIFWTKYAESKETGKLITKEENTEEREKQPAWEASGEAQSF